MSQKVSWFSESSVEFILLTQTMRKKTPNSYLFQVQISTSRLIKFPSRNWLIRFMFTSKSICFAYIIYVISPFFIENCKLPLCSRRGSIFSSYGFLKGNGKGGKGCGPQIVKQQWFLTFVLLCIKISCNDWNNTNENPFLHLQCSFQEL